MELVLEIKSMKKGDWTLEYKYNGFIWYSRLYFVNKNFYVFGMYFLVFILHTRAMKELLIFIEIYLKINSFFNEQPFVD